MGPRVDVIIPTFNRCDLTLRAVDSVLRQTHTALRVLLIDDASTDDTADRLTLALPDDPRLVFIRASTNRGAPAARQWLFDNHVDSDWVALLDSDDEWHPMKLERQLRLACQHPEAGVILCWHEWRPARSGDAHIRKPDVHPTAPPSPLATSNMSTPMIRRTALVDAGGFTPGGISLATCDNLDLHIRLSRVTRFACVPELLVTCWHASQDRVSRDNVSPAGARELRFLVERERPHLAVHPSELSDLEVRAGCRLLAAGLRGEGRQYLWMGLRRKPSRLVALRRAAGLVPFIIRTHVRRAGRRGGTAR